MSLIREVVDELHEIITNINHAFINGEFDHLPDPLEERDRLISQYLTIRLDKYHETQENGIVLPALLGKTGGEQQGTNVLP